MIRIPRSNARHGSPAAAAELPRRRSCAELSYYLANPQRSDPKEVIGKAVDQFAGRRLRPPWWRRSVAASSRSSISPTGASSNAISNSRCSFSSARNEVRIASAGDASSLFSARWASTRTSPGAGTRSDPRSLCTVRRPALSGAGRELQTSQWPHRASDQALATGRSASTRR
jgi:hypothetical protein